MIYIKLLYIMGNYFLDLQYIHTDVRPDTVAQRTRIITSLVEKWLFCSMGADTQVKLHRVCTTELFRSTEQNPLYTPLFNYTKVEA